MRRLHLAFRSTRTAQPAGLTPLAVGLTMLIAVAVWPRFPAVTGMALVALGATNVTAARFRDTAAFLPAMLLHLVTYGGLYVLFVGATLHAAATPPGASPVAYLDLAASIGPICIVFERTAAALLDGRQAG
jgi:hypothetical protein